MPLHKLQSTDGLLNFNEVDSRLKMSTVLDTCSGDNVQSVQDMIQKDRRLNIRYIADSLKMLYDTTRHIIMPPSP